MTPQQEEKLSPNCLVLFSNGDPQAGIDGQEVTIQLNYCQAFTDEEERNSFRKKMEETVSDFFGEKFQGLFPDEYNEEG